MCECHCVKVSKIPSWIALCCRINQIVVGSCDLQFTYWLATQFAIRCPFCDILHALTTLDDWERMTKCDLSGGVVSGAASLIPTATTVMSRSVLWWCEDDRRTHNTTTTSAHWLKRKHMQNRHFVRSRIKNLNRFYNTIGLHVSCTNGIIFHSAIKIFKSLQQATTPCTTRTRISHDRMAIFSLYISLYRYWWCRCIASFPYCTTSRCSRLANWAILSES